MANLAVAWSYPQRRDQCADPADGACAMNAVNWLVHEKRGDAPESVCPVIAFFTIVGGDAMPDGVRQGLLPFLPRMAGSRSWDSEPARVRIVVLAALRIFAPRALDAVSLAEWATRLRALPDDIDWHDAQQAGRAALAALEERSDAPRSALAALAMAVMATAEAAEAESARSLGPSIWAAARAARKATPAAGAAIASALSAQAANALDQYLVTLDAVLNAGPQGTPWTPNVAGRWWRHW
jgi:hypothetical protein